MQLLMELKLSVKEHYSEQLGQAVISEAYEIGLGELQKKTSSPVPLECPLMTVVWEPCQNQLSKLEKEMDLLALPSK
jgi:hypothetical protein